jgi:hypothetical protein
MAKKPDGFWIYVIEISPKWIPHLPKRKVPAGTERLLYVGYTENGPQVRLQQHLRGEHCTDDAGKSSATFFRTIRRRREEQGLPGQLVEGEDAWLVPDLVEQYETPELARPREGLFADELGAQPGTVAWSNEGAAAEERAAAAVVKKKRSARRRRRKARKAAEAAGD